MMMLFNRILHLLLSTCASVPSVVHCLSGAPWTSQGAASCGHGGVSSSGEYDSGFWPRSHLCGLFFSKRAKQKTNKTVKMTGKSYFKFDSLGFVSGRSSASAATPQSVDISTLRSLTKTCSLRALMKLVCTFLCDLHMIPLKFSFRLNLPSAKGD